VFSPGGNWKAITGSDGSFSLVPLTATLAGDYNNNGTVDAADYVVWRNGDSPDDTQAGYDLWKANFGKTSPGAGGGGVAVPEPGSVMLGLAAVAWLVATGRGAKRS
jgi:hypothetical protein